MAANEHVQPEQLRMFMTPREIVEGWSTHIGDRSYRGTSAMMTNADTWRSKYHEAVETGLARQVAEHGVEYPVRLGTMRDSGPAVLGEMQRGRIDPRTKVTGKPMMTGGQHRVAAALVARPNQFIPVLHDKDILEAKGYEGHVPDSHYRWEPVPNMRGAKVRRERVEPWGPYR